MCSAHDTGKSNQTQSECCRNTNEDATGQSENTTKQHNATDTPSRVTVCTMNSFP